ncbi:2-phosphosulfolactate phosphatase [Spirosoma montaniterrae]|uniref:Probable 2-phosphosulfolactate phosphatase n=1 Tax=Spirosoma montaniterrae TaxID=1178516 RepID=A0A1P9X303_9BACT|nr:2-phosphosulfolactate phosphatase [Spirosoma montaniterrae]AQG81999.1 2-phosphosulfolactate phosphatase [Spirosoma montaniterrae]
MKHIDVCLTPDLLHLHTIENTIVVVADVFRATSCMVTAFAYGVNSIVPVATIEECRQWQERGYLAAAERNARKVEGFELDNSPFTYMTEQIRGANIAVTTTNGTLAITKSRSAVKVLVGSFLNLDAIARYLKSERYDVMVLCAGWKGRVNMEDTLFAGALIDRLKDSFALAEDSAIMAHRLYCDGKDNLVSYMANASHIRRLQKLGIQRDITYCLQHDLYEEIPVLRGNALVRL